jgi:hypothetical protein
LSIKATQFAQLIGEPAVSVSRQLMLRKPTVGLVNVTRLLLDAGAMAECGLVHRVAAPVRVLLMLTRADGEDDATSISGPDDGVLRLAGAVHEVPLPQWPLLALDDQQRLAYEDEEILLIGLPVVHRHLFARGERIETDSNLREVRFAFEAQTLSAPLLVSPGAVTGVQDEPALRGGHKPGLGLFERCLGHNRLDHRKSARFIGARSWNKPAMRRTSLLLVIYLVIGVIVASSENYLENLDRTKRLLSAALAIAVWPLVLLGFDVRVT